MKRFISTYVCEIIQANSSKNLYFSPEWKSISNYQQRYIKIATGDAMKILKLLFATN